ncbi:MAG: hypothetical protein ACYCP0_08190 [Acidiferrobacteraceae bacterium]
MCRELEVAPSGYYEWLKKPISDRALEDARLLRLSRASFDRSHGVWLFPVAGFGLAGEFTLPAKSRPGSSH